MLFNGYRVSVLQNEKVLETVPAGAACRLGLSQTNPVLSGTTVVDERGRQMEKETRASEKEHLL